MSVRTSIRLSQISFAMLAWLLIVFVCTTVPYWFGVRSTEYGYAVCATIKISGILIFPFTGFTIFSLVYLHKAHPKYFPFE